MTSNAVHTITHLARLRDPSKQNELAMGITDLCTAQPLSEVAGEIAGEILVMVSTKANTPSKVHMAEKLAVCRWAPHSIIRHLAFEEIEVASLVIKKSKTLTEKDMVDLARDGSRDHRRTLAARPNLALVVTDILAEPAEAPILRALANNDTAEISENTLDICLTVAKDNPKLREALARRHDLSTEFATQLCIMLPENWREEMYRRFGLDKAKVEKLTIETALSATSESKDEEAAKTVADAIEAGRLTGDFALTAIKAGNIPVFDHAIAHLCSITPAQWRVALAMNGVRAAAMACQAAELNRGAYPIIHKALMKAGRIHQVLEGDAMTAAANVFRMYGADKASKVLRQMGSRS